MHDYEKAGAALGRILLKYKYQRTIMCGVMVVPIIVLFGIKFLLT